jgi:hypothetical protein
MVFSYTLEVSEAELQSKVSAMMPSDGNLKHKLAKSVLKSIKVENEKLHIVLSVF